MIVTSTDIKNNFGKYIRLAAKEDIIITKNGKKACKLVACQEEENNGPARTVMENAPAYDYDRKKVSYEEFLKISANSDERYEYIDGEIYLLSSPKTLHQKILLEMTGVFYNWFKGKKCTPMIAPYDIKLQRNENNRNIVQPDLMVICDLDEKLGADDYYTGVPALIAEIISASTKSKDYVKKLDLYMSCGVREYWIVDPENREVHVYLFENEDISKNRTFLFNDEIKSFYFKDFALSLNEL
jgi:prevent-host-death family protein